MVYRLQDTYDYQLPPLPPKEEILYWDKKTKDQFWERENVDFEKANKTWTDEKKIQFSKRELNRRTHGIWFYNNGEPTYITGSHYFFLQYFLVPVPEEEGTDFTSEEFQKWTQLVWSFADAGMMYPQYREYQKEFFYFLDLVAKDRYCEGGAVSKPRRVGITACFNADVMNLSMLKPQKKFSLMNKDRTDAIEVNYNPIKWNVERFPSLKVSNGKEIFKPKVAKLHVTTTLFASPDDDKTDELNTSIAIKSTVENANDGMGTYRLIRDEVSKYPPEVDISNMLFILRPVARVGTRQVGKIFFFGTSAEKDTTNFTHWNVIYWDSDYTARNGDKTNSGLYKYFISGKYSLEGNVKDANGIETELFDRYGKCKEELAIIEITNNIRPYRDAGDLQKVQSLRRQFPIYENDPFDSTMQTNCFDSFRLNIQRQAVEQKQKRVLSGLDDPFYTKGRLEWVVKDKEVKFSVQDPDHPNVNDNWIVYRLPQEQWKNKNYTDQYGFLNPEDTSPHIVTCDPIDYRNYIAQGSKPAILVGSMLDSSLPHGGMTVDARFLFRPNNPNDVIENMRMALIFWSAKGGVETNKAWLAIDLIKGRDDQQNQRPNYGRFLLTYDKNLKAFRQWRYGEKEIAGIFTGTGSAEGYVRDGNIYLKEPKSEGDIDRLQYLEDLEIIKQLSNFDPTKTTKYDLAIAFLLYTMILKNYNQIAPRRTGISDGDIIRSWFRVKGKDTKLPRHLTRIDQSEMV